jgi:hypothetical protein
MAALVTGGWLAACSRPAEDTGPPAASGPSGDRDIRLVGPPAAEALPVSDLEAGRSPRLPRARPAQPSAEPFAAAAPAGPESPEAALPAASDPLEAAVPAEPAVGESAAPAPGEFEPAPEVIRAPMPAAWTGGTGQLMGGIGDDLPAAGRRGPAIILRGGRGGVDDDCDLHRPRGRGPGGIAINRNGPVLPGGDMVSNRLPGLTGRPVGIAGLPRGGIR